MISVDEKEVYPSNAPRYDRFEDMAQMGELNEACVLDNLKQRYQSDLIYVNHNNNAFIYFKFLVLFRAFRGYS